MAKNKKMSFEDIDKEFGELFGKDNIKTASEIDDNYDMCSLDCIGLDKIMGIGGLPKGRIIEIIGWEGSSKTTIMLEYIAQEQKRNKNAKCAFIDCEHALDITYAKNIGVDLTRLKVFTPMSGEDAFDMLQMATETHLFEVIAFDSIAAAIPASQTEESFGKSSMTQQARLVNKALETLAPLVKKANTLVLMSNQFREKIGVMFGSPNVTKGGNAPKFYASIRIELTKSETKTNSKEENGERVSNLIKVKTIKNKMAPPHRKAQFYVRYGEGIDRAQELMDLGLETGVITKTGRSFYYKEDKICMGKDNLRQCLKDNPEVSALIRQDIIDSYDVIQEEPSLIDIVEEEEND